MRVGGESARRAVGHESCRRKHGRCRRGVSHGRDIRVWATRVEFLAWPLPTLKFPMPFSDSAATSRIPGGLETCTSSSISQPTYAASSMIRVGSLNGSSRTFSRTFWTVSKSGLPVPNIRTTLCGITMVPGIAIKRGLLSRPSDHFREGSHLLRRDSLGAITMSADRLRYIGLLVGRLFGVLLLGAGAVAAVILYSEFRIWTEPMYIRIALVIPAVGAVAFACIQGWRMFRAKTSAELGFTPDIRVFAVAIIIASFLVGLLLRLPVATAAGPVAALTLVLQVALLVGGLVPLMRGPGRQHRDGA